MNYKKHLLIILLIAILFRLGPVMLHGMPVGYDAPFHERMAGSVLDSGFVTAEVGDAGTGGRPNNYPPLYHVLTAELSLLTGIGVHGIVMFLLPLFSALCVLSVFVFVRAVSGDKNALISALLVAVATPLIGAAYDSPENFVFFFLPVALLLMHKGHEKAGALVYVSAFMWNYFALLASAVPFLLAYWRRGKAIGTAIVGIIVMLCLGFLATGTTPLTAVSLSSAMEFVQYNLRTFVPAFFGLGILFFVPLAWLGLKQNEKIKKLAEFRFLYYWCVISFAGILSLAITPLLRGWEHLKFLALAGIMLLGIMGAGAGGIRAGRAWRMFAVFLCAFMLVCSLLFSTQVLFPRINAEDQHAITFLEARAQGGSGTIIAAPAMSEYVRLNTELDNRLLTSLYFENAGEGSMLGETLGFLMGAQGAEEETEFLRESGAGWIITNFEDSAVRGASRFAEDVRINKIYSLAYSRACPFPLPRGVAYNCGALETEVFEIRG